jgi:hypothetical protein
MLGRSHVCRLLCVVYLTTVSVAQNYLAFSNWMMLNNELERTLKKYSNFISIGFAVQIIELQIT